MSGARKDASIFARKSGGRAAEPERMKRSSGTAPLAKAPGRKSRAAFAKRTLWIVGTAVNQDTPCVATNCQCLPSSNMDAMATRPPTDSVESRGVTRPPMWKRGWTINVASRAVMP